MRTFLSILLLYMLTVCAVASTQDMLSYTVRIHTGKSYGSGVVIHSKKDTFIATANHVVEDTYQKLEAPDKKGMVTVYRDMNIEFFRYEGGRLKETMVRTGRVVSFDVAMDIAIIRLNRRAGPIVDGAIATAPIGITPDVFDEVYSIGSGLGQVPFPTKGIVASLDGVSTDMQKGDPVFILHSAHTIWGFSGGGLFRYNRYSLEYELVGINVQIGIRNDMFRGSTVLTFMSYAVKMDDVRKIALKAGIKI